MSAFEFFFSFYGLLLGLCVAELVGGFARVLHERQRVRFGWRTPVLALFVAIDIATFWNQAWVIFRGAPFNTFLLILGLAIAATFYIAASVTFPRLAEDTHTPIDLDQHFWEQRRVVFSCIMAANLIVAVLLILLGLGNEQFAKLAASPLTARSSPLHWSSCWPTAFGACAMLRPCWSRPVAGLQPSVLLEPS